MFCRKCGRDMGDSLFCPDCGTKQRMDGCEPVSEGNYANASQLKSEVFEKYKKTTKIINTITSILVALLTLMLFIVAFSSLFLEMDFSKASTEDSSFKLALECAIRACGPIAFMFSGILLISYVRNLITTLILRSTVTKNNLSPHDLLPYTQINGEYTIIDYTWNGTNIKKHDNGFGISMNIVNSDITHLQATVECDVKPTVTHPTVYTSYQHAVASVTLAQSQNYTLGGSGLGSVFVFPYSIAQKYDGMSGISISY